MVLLSELKNDYLEIEILMCFYLIFIDRFEKQQFSFKKDVSNSFQIIYS